VALDSVLAKAQQLEVFVHTITGEIMQITTGTRLPRRTQRFVGLMEQLLLNKRVPLKGDPLLQIVPGNLETYLKSLEPSQTFLLSVEGTRMSPTQLAKTLVNETKPVVLMGGFAHGKVNSRVLEFVDQQVSIDPELLAASTTVGMLVHSVEGILDLSSRRFGEAK
jgi:rRNA small subunit pseudouridine methyltransferase Nep1